MSTSELFKQPGPAKISQGMDGGRGRGGGADIDGPSIVQGQ